MVRIGFDPSPYCNESSSNKPLLNTSYWTFAGCISQVVWISAEVAFRPLVQQCWESVQNQNLSRLTHNTSFWLSYPCLGSITLTQTHFRSFWLQKHQPSHGLAFCQAATTWKMGSVWMSTSESFQDASIPNQMEFKAIASDDQLGWAWPQEG